MGEQKLSSRNNVSKVPGEDGKASTMKIDLECDTIFNDKTNLESYRESTQVLNYSAINERKPIAVAEQLKSSM